MQIVIDIDDRFYELLKHDVEHGLSFRPCKIIVDGKPLPKGHGRLIDADALIKNGCFYETEMDLRDNAPTVIEADKEGEDDRD